MGSRNSGVGPSTPSRSSSIVPVPTPNGRRPTKGSFDDASVSIIGKGPDENTVYLLETLTGDIGTLSYIDLTTGEITNVFRPARTDVHTYYLDGGNELYAVRYDDHFPQWFYPNPKHIAAQIHNLVRGQFKSMNVSLTFARDNSKAIATVSGDANPGTYYLFDTDGNKLKKLFDRNEAVANYKLGERHPLEFPGPDDTRIPAYVTLPKGAGQNLPFIVWVHDGLTGGMPATWGYDAEAQFFASLGIGVLNVNHRGKMGLWCGFHQGGIWRVGQLHPGRHRRGGPIPDSPGHCGRESDLHRGQAMGRLRGNAVGTRPPSPVPLCRRHRGNVRHGGHLEVPSPTAVGGSAGSLRPSAHPRARTGSRRFRRGGGPVNCACR